MDIEFSVNHQLVQRKQKKQPANHSQKYLQLSFDFETDDWDNLTKFALFSVDGVKYRQAISNDKVIVPNACLQKNKFLFSIYGLDNNDLRVTTNRIQISLTESGYTQTVENDIPDDDPSIVEEIYLAINNKAEEVIQQLTHSLLNRVSLTASKDIIQYGETVDLKGYCIVKGAPKEGVVINFYEVTED